ncbi:MULTISPECIES: DsrE family protein [Rhodonellum]|uniref:Intracellular sulfur oxidation protein, DsrE/DsrF family n=1 Tax=Rhodonellum ikkaensis TaxID=336829 RepID=A0A1H3PGQ9_9BACT|nr:MULTISPECIES: DsrE family protein [Rhodonellum]SDZ00005.1 Intracellular sulfur oxidation protein, DsrE/DsrF family [Rhodonellum ikkaensis]
MTQITKISVLAGMFFFLLAQASFSQNAQFPIVKGHGGIYEIPDATENPDPNAVYKIIVDLTFSAEDPTKVNRMVDNIARMINLHGLAGTPKENIKVKVVVHGGAIFTVLKDEAYEKLYGVKNPNLDVFKALQESGVEVYICGQSLVARALRTSDVWEGTQIALSALTTLTTYIPQGYVYFKF